ncbi:MAG: hypothetical protein MJY76_03620 [Bacteroidales bacterium]|nr:hypothetical protein [Bacteroidales bacterium]
MYYYDDEDYEYSYNENDEYERDTFYALGGYDYDEFKRHGGNIDDMMDALGF